MTPEQLDEITSAIATCSNDITSLQSDVSEVQQAIDDLRHWLIAAFRALDVEVRSDE